eukprot:GILJ01012672.1.p1 GENE.GILJ01012672.1~~GILJ01012672.1.p1  ORF type:complete len:258 (+),score=39.69 GILJ01012672.1:243-1016(+)
MELQPAAMSVPVALVPVQQLPVGLPVGVHVGVPAVPQMAMAFDPKQIGRLDWSAQHVHQAPECQVKLSVSMETKKPGRYVMDHHWAWGRIQTGPDFTAAHLKSSMNNKVRIGTQLCAAGCLMPACAGLGAIACVYQQIVNRSRDQLFSKYGGPVLRGIDELLAREPALQQLDARTSQIHMTIMLSGKKLYTKTITPHNTLRPRICNCASILSTMFGLWCCGSCGLETPFSHLGQIDDMHFLVEIQPPLTEKAQATQC